MVLFRERGWEMEKEYTMVNFGSFISCLVNLQPTMVEG